MKPVKKLSICGVLAAAEVVILFFASMFSMMDLTLTAFTVFLTAFAVLEVGGKYPWMIYGVVSVLSLLLLQLRFAVVVYVLFVGFYPMLKALFEKRSAVLGWILKLAAFNVCLVVILELCRRALSFTQLDTVGYFALTALLANGAFILFDVMLTVIITLYLRKFREKYKINKWLK